MVSDTCCVLTKCTVTITGEILRAAVHRGHDVVCLQPSERKVEALLNLIEEDDETQVPDLSEIDFNTPSSQRKRPSSSVGTPAPKKYSTRSTSKSSKGWSKDMNADSPLDCLFH